MKKPPTLPDVVTTFRLPAALHAEIKDAARAAGHPMNAEIIARLESYPKGTSLGDIAKQNKLTQDMIQQILDALSPRKPGK